MLPRPSGFVTLLTDFPPQDPYVGILKGALLRASPKVQIVDYAHGLPPQDVQTAAFFVAAAIGRFPSGTVHVAVVDPGVGTARRLLAVAAHDAYWLMPDNGLLSGLADLAAEVRAIDGEHLGVRAASNTFHGRDILSPVAAWLATGRYGFSALGPRVDDAQRRASAEDATSRVVFVDGYGNLITNLKGDQIGGAAALRIGGQRVPFQRTYGEVAVGELLACVGSFGLVEVAQNCGHAARTLGLAAGAPIALANP